MENSFKEASILIRELTTTLSVDFVQRLAGLARSCERLEDLTRAKIMREVSNDKACERIASFMTKLSHFNPEIRPKTLAFGIQCALATIEQTSGSQSIDVVWTGPETSIIAVRRSAAVLIELIENVMNDLIVVSFASFRIPDAMLALDRAANRGVCLHFILESEYDSSGRLHRYGLPTFSALQDKPNIRYYRWPKEKRPNGALLHAKAVVADGNSALITSANLTENAIASNIELGVIIKGGSIPRRIHDHFMSLIQAHEFQEIVGDISGF